MASSTVSDGSPAVQVTTTFPGPSSAASAGYTSRRDSTDRVRLASTSSGVSSTPTASYQRSSSSS